MIMKSFFESRKIAVIGASRDERKVGNVIFRNLLESKNLKVFPVNPNADSVSGQKCFSSVLEIPYLIDMALIVVKAEVVPSVLEECGKKEIKNVIIISAGFSEAGNMKLSEEVIKIAEKYKIKIIGPNVLGIINPYKNMNASFFCCMPDKGNVGFISQSGAVGTSILDKTLENHLGVSAFVSLGNMLQQDFINALDYFANDIHTEIIALYVESLKPGTGKDFLDLCKRISKKKKIIALKAGKSEEGKEAAKTHTASLSSDSKIYSGAFKQAGIIEADSIEEMFMLAEIFSKYGKLGKKACIITNAGGLGVLATDSLVKTGLEVVNVPEVVLKELDKFMPSGYSRRNPLDILGDALAERYEKVLRILKMYEAADFYVVIVSPQEMTQALETAKVLAKFGKPVFACYIGGKSFLEAKRFMKEEGIINFEDVSELEILGKAA